MINVNLLRTALILTTFFCISSCQKENVCDHCLKPNKAPIAKAGPDQVITLPINSVTLDGQGSTDADGTIREWRWHRIAGPANAIIQEPDSSRTQADHLTAGIYQFELTVTDDQGMAAHDTVRIFVDAVATSNHPPVAIAGTDQIITLPASIVTLNGSASYDLENNISDHMWRKITGPNAGLITNPDMLESTVTQLVEGLYGFELTVMDSGGLEGTDTVFITVLSGTNHPPEANAGPDQSFAVPLNSAALNGSGSSDPDNNLVSYHWSKLSGPASFDIQQPTNAQTVVQQLSLGVYKFELKVTDAGGLTDTDTMQITVTSAPVVNHAPSADAGADQVITLPVNMAYLFGWQSTDPENNITIYTWRQINGPAPTTIINFGIACQVRNLIQGLYQFELTVIDQGGLVSLDTIQVAVNPVPTGNPAVFDNLFWFESCYIRIPDINLFIPAGSSLNVEIKTYSYQGQASAWMRVPIQGSQVPGDFAYYTILNGNLDVHSLLIDCNFDDAQSYSIRINF